MDRAAIPSFPLILNSVEGRAERMERLTAGPYAGRKAGRGRDGISRDTSRPAK